MSRAARSGAFIALVAVGAAAVTARALPPREVPVRAPAASVRAPAIAIEAPAVRIVATSTAPREPQPKPVPQPKPKPRPTPGPKERRTTLRSEVLFRFARAELTDRGRVVVDGVARSIRRTRGVGTILVEGHTDSIGGATWNLGLSRRRAAAVAVELRRGLGGRAPRIAVAAFGESRPVAPNIHPDGSDDPAGRGRNRRVEIVLVLRGR